MADRSISGRSKSLARLVGVQEQMVRLAEWRLAAAERDCRDLAEDKHRLQGYLVETGALGVPLAKAALRSLEALDRRLAEAERERVARKSALASAAVREGAVTELAARVRREAARAAADRALADIVDVWLASGPQRTSLP